VVSVLLCLSATAVGTIPGADEGRASEKRQATSVMLEIAMRMNAFSLFMFFF
jgi:hypothetical protein